MTKRWNEDRLEMRELYIQDVDTDHIKELSVRSMMVDDLSRKTVAKMKVMCNPLYL